MASKPLPSPEDLRQLMSYDPETGKLFWKERGAEWFTDGTYHTAEVQAQIWNTKYAGKEAFTPLNSCRYHTGAVLGKILLAHRIAWAITHGRWQARITVERRQKHLGYYDTPEAAAAAYAEAARRHHGEFARTA